MEGLTLILGLVGIVWGILNIILFFKIWTMTNDIIDIKNALLKKEKINQDDSFNCMASDVNDIKNILSTKLNTHHDDKFDVGSVVINTSTNEELRILGSYNDGNFLCCDNNTNELRGKIHESVLKLK